MGDRRGNTTTDCKLDDRLPAHERVRFMRMLPISHLRFSQFGSASKRKQEGQREK